MLEPYPTYCQTNVNEEAEKDIEWLKGVIIAVRNLRGEMDISPAKSINLLLRNGTQADRESLETHKPYLKKLAKLENISWLEADEEVPVSATQRFNELEILVPLEGLIDIDDERARLTKEIDKLISALTLVEKKLNNEKFVSNAPPAIVQKEEQKKIKIDSALKSFQEQLVKLNDVS